MGFSHFGPCKLWKMQISDILNFWYFNYFTFKIFDSLNVRRIRGYPTWTCLSLAMHQSCHSNWGIIIKYCFIFLLFFLRQEGSSILLRKGKKRSFQSIFLRSLNSPCYPHTLRRNSGVSFSFYSELLFQIAHPESHSSLYAAGSLNPKFTFFD